MKLFIYEHITSGALIDEPLPTSLAREGNDMLIAIVQDLLELSTIELILLRDDRLDPLAAIIGHSEIQITTIKDYASFQSAYHDAIKRADAILPIAPETDGILNNIQQDILNSNKQLLASQAEAMSVSSDKYQCHQQLLAYGLSSPTTVKASEWSMNQFTSSTGFIIKPRDGAGCMDTLFIKGSASLKAWLASPAHDLENTIIQPYIDGITMSLNILSDNDDSRVLAINKQHFQRNNRNLSFTGSTVNGVDESIFSITQASSLVAKIHQAISGLWGFIGIDLIVRDNEVFILDINPRLTTSYIGLKASLGINPAQLLFTMIEQGLSALPKTIQRHAVEVRV
ncbi:MAG: ATP-grasp domain-containing protein [Methylophaga sp.]|nr:ATP-grasp domain-containing protein [Methylophaga sp.]